MENTTEEDFLYELAYLRDKYSKREELLEYCKISTIALNPKLAKIDNLFPFWAEIRKEVLKNGGIIV